MKALKDEKEQMIRAAWLWFVGGYTQEAISELLGVSRVKVSRLISQAGKENVVHVFVDGHETIHMEHENLIQRRFNLDYCRICTSMGEGREFDAVGNMGARLLYDVIKQGEAKTIGLGNGRTIAAVVGALPMIHQEKIRFVSLLGGLTRKASASPFDMIHKVCEKTNGEGFFMPVPIFADSIKDKEVFMQQRILQKVLEIARAAEFSMFGVGAIRKDSYLIDSGQITPEEFESLVEKKAVAEILGNFIDAQGKPVDVDLNERNVGLSFQQMRGMNNYLIISGKEKAEALNAVLVSGLIKGAIIEENLARVFVHKFI